MNSTDPRLIRFLKQKDLLAFFAVIFILLSPYSLDHVLWYSPLKIIPDEVSWLLSLTTSILVIILVFKYKIVDIRELGLKRGKWYFKIFESLVLVIIIIAVQVVTVMIWEFQYDTRVENSLETAPGYYIWIWTILRCLEAGFIEELIFRGLIFNYLKNFTGSVLFGLIISSFLFGTLHIYQGYHGFIVAVVIGGLFCYFYHLGKSIIPLIIAHLLYDILLTLSELPN